MDVTLDFLSPRAVYPHISVCGAVPCCLGPRVSAAASLAGRPCLPRVTAQGASLRVSRLRAERVRGQVSAPSACSRAADSSAALGTSMLTSPLVFSLCSRTELRPGPAKHRARRDETWGPRPRKERRGERPTGCRGGLGEGPRKPDSRRLQQLRAPDRLGGTGCHSERGRREGRPAGWTAR